jgi:hypothetical protein
MSSVTVRNVSDKSIESLLVLIEFVNAEGSRLETGLYYATTHRFSDELLQVQKGYGIQKLEHPLEPNEEMGLSAVSDVVLLGCPAKGIVTKADVRFNDSSKWSRSSSTWLTDPIFREATVDMNSFPATVPFAFCATVDLSSHGQATIIESGELDSQVSTWLQKQVNEWSIVPGDRGPLAQDIQRFTMLVRINGRDTKYSTRKWMLKSNSIDSPLIVVDIAPVGSSHAKLPVTIGGMLASSHAVGNVP